MKVPSNGFMANPEEGERKSISSELWHACAGPLVSLPPAGSLVVYFPQGHSEQVAASMQKQTDFIPSYPNLPSKLICMLHNVTLHADTETDEVYAQMTLQPVNKYEKEALLASDMGLKQNRQPTEFFCKTLTASDTSTHGGFSVPRRAAEKIFPPLDFSMQPPAQELVARDLHDNSWTFRHIFRAFSRFDFSNMVESYEKGNFRELREIFESLGGNTQSVAILGGQPKRHLLTTGWSVFVSTKRLLAGNSVLFIRDEKSQLLLGIRRANRQQPALSSSVISSDSMHIGILAAAAHAAANNSPFTVFFNPRASPAEFVVPFSKYNKAMYTQVSLGMRFRMMFETEESGIRRYMGTVTGINDMDSVRWKNSQWRNLQVGWDESAAGERPSRVSIWDIEPVVTPFYICPPPFFRPKFPKQSGMPDDDSEFKNAFRRVMPWLGDDFGMKDPPNSLFPGLSLVQWMSMQQNNQLPTTQAGFFPPMHNNLATDDPSKLLNFQTPGLHFNKPNSQNQPSQLAQPSMAWTQQQQQRQQQQLQQLLQANMNQQQQLTQQQQPQSQQMRQKSPNLQQQQQIYQSPPVNNGLVSPNQVPNQNLQQPNMYPQLQQQQQLLADNTASKGSCQTQFQQQMEEQSRQQPQTQLQQNLSQRTQIEEQCRQQQQAQLQQNLSQRTQLQPQAQQLLQANLSEQQLHLQLLQKLQQQQQLLSPTSSQLLQQQQSHQQNPLLHQSSLSPSFPVNQSHGLQKSPTTVRPNTTLTGGEAPSCSTSPSTDNCQVSSSNFQNRNPQAPALLTGDSTVEPANNLIPELNRNSDFRVRQDFPGSKGLEQQKYKGTMTDQMEASSAVSYSLDTTNIQQNFTLPPFDGLAPDTLLSQGYDSQKDLQHLLHNYGCSNDVAVNDSGGLNGGMWANQAQRMRTYTKVQKRGSVGRSIDVTRYKGYDDLRLDLARMFGIEGQLEDPQSSEWKLVYVDHENDILLVGDDPWEEFISCVQSIKILSSAEVQQMSLDGDLAAVPGLNQACSGSDSGNAWRGQYDDNSAASFNR